MSPLTLQTGNLGKGNLRIKFLHVLCLRRRRRLKGTTTGQTQTGLGPRVYPFTTPHC